MRLINYNSLTTSKSRQQHFVSRKLNFGLQNQQLRFKSDSHPLFSRYFQVNTPRSKCKTNFSPQIMWKEYKQFFHSSSMRFQKGDSDQDADIVGEKSQDNNVSPETKEKMDKTSEILLEGHKADMSGLFETAIDKYSEALKLLEELSGPNSDAVGQISHSLGVVYVRVQRYDEARQLINRSIHLAKQQVGAGHTITVQRQLSYCRVLMETGEVQTAEDLLRQLCIDVAGQEKGEQILSSIFTASMGSLSDPLDSKEQIERKEELGNVLFNYGVLKSKTQKPKKATRLFMQAMMLWELEIKGKEHHRLLPSMAVLHKELGKSYADMGSVAQAKANLMKALELLEEHCPDNSFEMLDALNYRISLEMQQKNYDDAEKLCRKCINIFEREGISFYPQDYASQLQMLGTILYEKGLHGTFDRPIRKAIEVRRHLFGDDDTRLANSYNHLGLLALHASREELAESNFAESVRIYRKNMPHNESADNKDMAATAVQLYSQILAGRGEEEEAKNVLELLSKMVFVLHLREHQENMENPEQVMDQLLGETPKNTGNTEVDEHQQKIQNVYQELLNVQKQQLEQNYSKDENNEMTQKESTEDKNKNNTNNNNNNNNNTEQVTKQNENDSKKSEPQEKPKVFKHKPKKKKN